MKVKKELDKDLQQETAKRINKLSKEFSKPPALKVFENTEKYDQMIMLANIEFSSLCEHHGVRFGGIVHVGYLPKDYLIGVSKLARVAEQFLNVTRPTIQEKATMQILNTLKKALDPAGIMIVIKAKHDCVGYRGVKKPSAIMITSAIDGAFKSELSGARQEFLALVAQQEKSLN